MSEGGHMPEIEIDGLTIVKGVEKLQDCFLFRELSYEESQMLAGICKPLTKNPGELVIEEKSIGQGLYLVVSGNVRVFKGTDKEERTLATLGPGEIFGEMSLIEDALTSSHVVADNETELLMIRKNDLEKLIDENERFAAKIYRSFCRVLSERLRRADEMIRR